MFLSKQLIFTNRMRFKSTKGFYEMPTLKKSLPVLGHSYLFLPGGRYKSERLTEAVEDLSRELGPIFRLKLAGRDMVIMTDADYAKVLFRNEGKHPIRPPFPALVHYRKKTFNSIGVVPGNGPEWYKFRAGVNPLLRTELIRAYVDRQRDVADAFVAYIKKNTDKDGILQDLFRHLLKFTIEAISITCPGFRFECLGSTNSDTSEVIQASIDFMEGLYSTLIGLPVWKLYKNAGYRKLESSHSIINRIIKEQVEKMKSEYERHSGVLKTHPFMSSLFANKNLSDEDVLMLAIEVFLGGIDATATTAAFTLHYLARDEETQQKARAETSKSVTDCIFLKACVKETLRLSPTSGGNARFLIKDTEIGGFNIPAGILVTAFFSVTARNEAYFKDPLEYRPQRWLRGSGCEIHPFASLPFGYGPRMCPGKRLAEQEIIILLQQILKNFKLEPAGKSDIGMVYRMNRIPDSPISVRFLNTNL